MTYATQQDLVDRFGNEELVQLTDRSNLPPSEIDATAVTRALAEGNAAYEERFDRVFIIRAAGRAAPEILGELRRRLGNDDQTERIETVRQLREIALLRLRAAVGETGDH